MPFQVRRIIVSRGELGNPRGSGLSDWKQVGVLHLAYGRRAGGTPAIQKRHVDGRSDLRNGLPVISSRRSSFSVQSQSPQAQGSEPLKSPQRRRSCAS